MFTVVDRFFVLFCVIATLSLTTYCLYRYSLDEDLSLVSFKKYHQDRDSVYPAVSLCFTDYLNSSAFQNILHEKEYKKFLRGSVWEDYGCGFGNINYEDAVIEINQFILEIRQASYSQELNTYLEKSYRPRMGTDQWKPTFYRSFSFPRWKCWTFEVSYHENELVTYFSMILKSDIFKDSIRKEFGNFMIILSYPGQLAGARVSKYKWRPISYPMYTMNIGIQNVMVFKKRNKKEESCHEDWRNSDTLIKKKLVEIIGCRPSFYDISTNLPQCDNYTKYAEVIRKHGYEVTQEPCQKIEKVLFIYEEHTRHFNGSSFGLKENTSMFEIELEFQGDTYMEIAQTRSYDVESLVGNGGGYVGLFLGIALMQFPTALRKCYHLLRAVVIKVAT